LFCTQLLNFLTIFKFNSSLTLYRFYISQGQYRDAYIDGISMMEKAKKEGGLLLDALVPGMGILVCAHLRGEERREGDGRRRQGRGTGHEREGNQER
jgi:hypothetical protein